MFRFRVKPKANVDSGHSRKCHLIQKGRLLHPIAAELGFRLLWLPPTFEGFKCTHFTVGKISPGMVLLFTEGAPDIE